MTRVQLHDRRYAPDRVREMMSAPSVYRESAPTLNAGIDRVDVNGTTQSPGHTEFHSHDLHTETPIAPKP